MLPLKPTYYVFFLLLFCCTGVDLIDDYIPPIVRITTTSTSIPIGKTFTFEASYFNNVGQPVEGAQIEWISSNPTLLDVASNGLSNPLKTGNAIIIAQILTEDGMVLKDSLSITIYSNVVFKEEEEEEEEETATTSDTILVSTSTPTLEISNQVAEITAQTNHQLEVTYHDENGTETQAPKLTWVSSDDSIIQIDQQGNLTAVSAGTATITVSFSHSNTLIFDQNTIQVNALVEEESTTFKGNLATKSGYTLQGSFTFSQNEDGILLALGEDYKASSTLPGLYVYLANNNNTTSKAYEIGAVKVFSGAHSYQLPSSIGIRDYQYILYWCKPFNVKVGEAKIYE